jgi:uncharacterized protein (DUF1800 family)
MVPRSDAVHLLRRTEFVARPDRVDQLVAHASIEAAVDDVLGVVGNPGSVSFVATAEWQRGVELAHYWLNRMAHDSPRPIQEKLALFWHGHFVSSMDKVGSGELMRQQIDLYRHQGLGNVRDLAIAMSTQVAMLRYLDNNENKRSSPNQNFGRELMELFLLGVGNYTEHDVEACTAAWTGHTDYWDTDQYRWRSDWHDGNPKTYLGQTINNGGDPTQHGAETILTMLGAGVVPSGPNAGRATREVAAEFLSRKLWTFFAGTAIPADVLAALRGTLLAGDFAIGPWVRALLTRPEFYSTEVKQGLVRSPVEYVVALLAATGLRSESGAPLWMMEAMGQALLYPPDVSGWRHNAAYVSASAFGARVSVARQVMWRSASGYWDDGGQIHLAGGTISRDEVEATSPWSDEADQLAANAQRRRDLADRMVDLMQIEIGPTTRAALHSYATQSDGWQLLELVALTFDAPEMHVS